jgi:hypothetical protein
MMKITKTTVFPALLALSLFGTTHAYAGNDGDMNPPPDEHVDTTNPNPDTHMPPDPDTNMPPDPGPEHVDKGGNPPTPPKPTPQPGPNPTDSDKRHPKRLVCVIGDQRFYVRYRSECVGPRVVYRDPGVIYAQPRKRVRTVRYAAPCNCAAARVTYGNASGDIVIGGGTRFIGSPAAVSQARKRAKRQLQYGGGYAYGGGYSDGGGYAYGGGYGYSDGGGYYEQAPVVRRKAKRLRRVRVQAYNPYPVYDPGVVVHYGPAIMKDGAY